VWLTLRCEIGVFGMMTPTRHRRRGAGRAVLTAALAAAWTKDTRGALLWSSPMGRQLYESVGFRAVEECAIWVLGGGEDMLAAIGNV
jgi:predicted GNAT family acetyltransferase